MSLLEDFAKVGKEIATMATKQHWAFEDHHKADTFAKMLPEFRQAYVDLSKGVQWWRVIKPLQQKYNRMLPPFVSCLLHDIVKQQEQLDNRDMR